MKSKDSVIGSVITTDKVRPKQVEHEGEVLLEMVYTVSDKSGKIKTQKTELGHSFLQNFIIALFGFFARYHCPDDDLVDTGGTSRTGSPTYSTSGPAYSDEVFDCNAPSTNDDFGVLIGTDDTAVDIADYALGAKIIEGSGSGQMNYGSHSTVSPVSDVGNTYSYAGITRTISNNSGASITVKEVGLVWSSYWDTSATRYFLLLREVLGSPISVADGEILTVTIRVKCFC